MLALTGDPLVLARGDKDYNPDQPRDSDGRFGEGGGSTSTGEVVQPGDEKYATAVYSAEMKVRDSVGSGEEFSSLGRSDKYANDVWARNADLYEGTGARSEYMEVRGSTAGMGMSGLHYVSEGGGVLFPVMELGSMMQDQLTILHETTHAMFGAVRQNEVGHSPAFQAKYLELVGREAPDLLGPLRSALASEPKSVKYSADQPRDERGRFGSGGGGSSTLAPEHLSALIDGIAARGEPTNITGMRVSGAGNEHLFAPDPNITPRDRAAMPVIPGGHDGAEEFAKSLPPGTDAKFEQVDPRSLVATQTKIDGVKTGQMLDTLRANNGSGTGTLIVSQDGRILDGHHRWAANAVYSVDHPGHTMEVLRVNEPFDRLMAQADAFSASHQYAAREFGKAFSPDQPRDPDGRFASGGEHTPATNKEYGERQVNGDIAKLRGAMAMPSDQQLNVPVYGTIAWRAERGYKQSGTDGKLVAAEAGDKRSYNALVKQVAGVAEQAGVEKVDPEVRQAMHDAIDNVKGDERLMGIADRSGLDLRFSAGTTRFFHPEDGPADAPRAEYQNGSAGRINLYDTTEMWGKDGGHLTSGWGNITPGGTTVADGWQGVITHEIGHGVHDQMDAGQRAEWNGLWESYNADYQQRMGPPGIVTSVDRGAEMRNTVSFYSTDNVKEGFAETFSAVMAPGYDRSQYGSAAQPLLSWMERATA